MRQCVCFKLYWESLNIYIVLGNLNLCMTEKFLLWFSKEQIGRRRQASMNCVHVEVGRSISVVMGDESIQKFIHCLLQSDLSKKQVSYLKKKKDGITIRSSAWKPGYQLGRKISVDLFLQEERTRLRRWRFLARFDFYVGITINSRNK